MNIVVWGNYLFEAKQPGQKTLRHAANLLDGNLDIITDILSISGKKFNLLDLKAFCEIFKSNILKFKIEVNKVFAALEEHNQPKKEVDKTVIVRRQGKERGGGRRIPKPTCIEELFAWGGEYLGINPVKVRDQSGREILSQDIPFLRNNEEVFLCTEEDEYD